MIYDDFADRLAAKYELFLLALTGKYLSDVSAGVEVSPMSVKRLREGAMKLSKTFYDDAVAELDAFRASVYSEASGMILAHRAMEVEAGIRGMLAENVTQVLKQHKGSLSATHDMLRDFYGAMGSLVQQKLTGIAFKLRDKAGKQWPAVTLMRTMLRDYAYQSWLDVQFDELLTEGHTLAAPVYAGEHRYAELVFSIDGSDAGYPSLDAIRDNVFHPNSTAIVAYVHP